jgi:hypothetical protein
MSDLVIETTACRECYAVLEATDNYCRHCGTATAHAAGLLDGDTSAASFSVKPAFAPSVQQPKWSESPWVVLPLLFLVLGPFALPLLWRSRRFSRAWKSILTVIMSGVTVYLVWCVWFAVQQALVSLRELDHLRGF